jgi:DUF1680 family protein
MKVMTDQFDLVIGGSLLTLSVLLLCAPNCHGVEMAQPAVADAVSDAFVPADISAARFEGYLGDRIRNDAEHRLLTLNLDDILAPYVHRPGPQMWAGEHAGKFLHAACLEWERTGDARLKQRIDKVAQALIASQLPDGYLGTYTDDKRWTSWDVWSHKYNLIGLLEYHHATGDAASLAACRKIGDLLCNTFGAETDGKRDILKSGTHRGMAATSVLEPMVMLYRYTGEKCYLEFCRYVVQSWENPPRNPKILSTLLAGGSVKDIADAKAYEMMSNLVGLLDLYRATGEKTYLQACETAWKEIRQHQTYADGTSSFSEFFQPDDLLRPGGDGERGRYVAAGEGCVTVTWLQMNLHLLRLSGDARYGDELERTTYNALLAAQSPTEGTVCYFLPMLGRKQFGEVNHGILPDISCCASSIPRGVAMIASFAAGTINGKPAILLYAPGEQMIHAGDMNLQLKMETDYPKSGAADIKIAGGAKGSFPLLLRVPSWCDRFEAHVGSETFKGEAGTFLSIERTWREGENIHVEMNLPLLTVPQGPGWVAIQRGPQVLAHDDSVAGPDLPAGWAGSQIYSVKGRELDRATTLTLVPLADAGQQKKAEYQAVFREFKLDGAAH